MARANMSARERDVRSQLAKLVHQEPMIRGTISVRKITCGKSGCHCAHGEKHLAVYLSASKDGRVQQMYIPADLEEDVRRWVRNYHAIRERLEIVSEIAWQELKSRKE